MPIVGVTGDVAGGRVTAAQGILHCNGTTVLVVGSPVAPHPPCPRIPIHCAPVMAAGSGILHVNGVPVSRSGDPATCGHALGASCGNFNAD